MRRQTSGLLTICLAIGVASPVAVGTTYYVNGDCGNDAWSGVGTDCVAPDGPKVTIQAGIDAASDDDVIIVAAGVYPERIYFHGQPVVLRSADGPEATVIDAERTGRVVIFGYGDGPDTVIEGFTVTGGFTDDRGGGIYVSASSPTIRNCIIKDNEAEHTGAMYLTDGASPLIDGCTFIDNWTTVAAGAATVFGGHPVFKDCLFRNNDAGLGDGAVVVISSDGTPPQFVNCRFIDNTGVMAGAVIDGGSSNYVNCVFSGNVPGALVPGALVTAGYSAVVINCTFSDNTGYGIFNDVAGGLDVYNSILWGNSEGTVGGDGGEIHFSDVEGGWPGPGSNNINVDPQFVQPGTANVRLAFGSPCADAGNNAYLPADAFDLDGDGNTIEPIPLDVAGSARIQGGTVDMGAYEGEFEAMPPAATATDLDQGDFVVLIPGGGPLDPLATAGAMVYNESGADDSSFVVTQLDSDPHPGAGGYSELSAVLRAETTLADGEYLAILFVPFDIDDFPGDFFDTNLTCYDPVVGNWALAVAANTVPSPDYATQYGDRVESGPSQGWGISNEPGDYGVFIDPFVHRGFVWAAVDHAGDFGVGLALCPSDCRQTPDGVVGVGDFLALLATWGDAAGDSPCDIEHNGVVNEEDFLRLLAEWGPCPRNSLPPVGMPGLITRSPRPRQALTTVRPADMDGNGAVERRDLLMLRESWGPCPGCDADLDGDGKVGVTDLLGLLAQWN
jgi:hypothetical protein